jgi:hypothetical protein
MPHESIHDMTSTRTRPFRRAAVFFTALFFVLLLLRLGVLDALLGGSRSLQAAPETSSPARESWMNIFHNSRKIGYAHTRLDPRPGGSELVEQAWMRVTTMGMTQELRLRTRARLLPDLSLERLEFELASGPFRFRAEGEVAGDTLTVHTETAGARRRIDLPLNRKLYLPAAVLYALSPGQLKPGDRYAFDIFDPATLGQAAVQLEVVERETIQVMGAELPAVRVSMGVRGMTQSAWIGEGGDILRERGLLGMRLEKTDRDDAVRGLGTIAGEDLAAAAAVAVDRELPDAAVRGQLRVRLGGPGADRLQLKGGRQTVADGVLTVERERLEELPPAPATAELGALERAYLRPEALIQSDHDRIKSQVRAILGEVSATEAPVEAARLLVEWVHRNIEKRPVLSLPDALSTLEHRMGDCNEHAVLLAALARAAGIPARVEAGVVYLRGRFYYHAWNLLYVGRWVTADAVFGQMPADVTHLRFVTGSSQQQLDLLGVMGNLTIEVIE